MLKSSAVAASTVRLSPRTEPKALLGIAVERPLQGSRQRVGHGRAAGVVVLDDDGGRLGELADNRQALSRSEQVVVGKLFAVQLPGDGYAGAAAVGPGVERRLLVRILAVAEHHFARQTSVMSGERPLGSAAGEKSAIARSYPAVWAKASPASRRRSSGVVQPPGAI